MRTILGLNTNTPVAFQFISPGVSRLMTTSRHSGRMIRLDQADSKKSEDYQEVHEL